MTWAEFLIRQHAYRRMDKNSWYKVREIAYSSMVGPHIDPKKLPKTKEAFIPLKDKIETNVNDIMRERIENTKKAFKIANNGVK